MAKRDHISLTTKLAAALLMLRDENGELLIPHEHAKLMSEDQVISLFQFDHYPKRKTDGGPDAHWNLEPKLIAAHRTKTADIDVPQIAKGKRIRITEARHAAAMAAKTGQGMGDLASALVPLADPSRARSKRKIQSRGFEKGHRPLRGRSSFERRAP